MAQVEYTAEVTATGNGRDGEVVSADGVTDEKLATPKATSRSASARLFDPDVTRVGLYQGGDVL